MRAKPRWISTNESGELLDVSARLRLVQVEVGEVVLGEAGQAGVVALALQAGGAHWDRPDLVLVVASVVVLQGRVEQVGLEIFQWKIRLMKIFQV